jgi:hypothetical protein
LRHLQICIYLFLSPAVLAAPDSPGSRNTLKGIPAFFPWPRKARLAF